MDLLPLTLDDPRTWVAADIGGALGLFFPHSHGPIPSASRQGAPGLGELLVRLGAERLRTLVYPRGEVGHPVLDHGMAAEPIVTFLRCTDAGLFFEDELARGWAKVEAAAPDPDVVLLSPLARAATLRLHEADGCEACFLLRGVWNLSESLGLEKLGFHRYWYDGPGFDAPYQRSFAPTGRPFSLLEVSPTVRERVLRLPVSFGSHPLLRPQDYVPCL